MHHPVLAQLRKACSTDVALLILRVAVGGAFIFHGHMKLMDLGKAAAFFADRGIPMAGFCAPFVSGLEFFGGMLLILGLANRLLGLMLAFDMMVAVLTGLKRPTWQAHELEILLFAGSMMSLLAGAGAYSIDALLMKKFQKEHETALPMKS